MYLLGFRNRANVLVNWAWNYLTYDRGARLLGEHWRDQSSVSTSRSAQDSETIGRNAKPPPY